jgi:hypothetical protein
LTHGGWIRKTNWLRMATSSTRLRSGSLAGRVDFELYRRLGERTAPRITLVAWAFIEVFSQVPIELNLPMALETTKRILEVNSLLAGIVLLAVFYLYWFAAKRPLTKIYETHPLKVSRILHGSERIFWGVWLAYAGVAIGWGVYSLFK